MENKQISRGMSSLHAAAANGEFAEVKRLLAQGESPQCFNRHQQSPLHSALLMPISHDSDLQENKTAIFKLLYAKAPSLLMHRDASGDTVVQLMAAFGFSELLAELLQSHTEIAFVSNNHSHYPIHTAILNNQIEIVDMLLKIPGVDSLADMHGQVALHYAVRYGTKEMVLRCCKDCTDINAEDDDHQTAWGLACSANNASAMEILDAHGAAHPDEGNYRPTRF